MNANQIVETIAWDLGQRFGMTEVEPRFLMPQGNNVSAKLTSSGGVYFAKCFTTDTFARVNRLLTFRTQRQLANLGMAVRPLALCRLPNSPWYYQIEEWFEADKDALPSIAALGAMLARLHVTPVAAPQLNLADSWQHYLVRLPPGPEKKGFEQEVKKFASIASHGPIPCLCHNDLHLSHLLSSLSGQPVLLDWEYSGHGNPWFDIASCIAINDFDQQQGRELLQAYAAGVGQNVVMITAQVEAMTPLVHLTNRLWFAAKGATDSRMRN